MSDDFQFTGTDTVCGSDDYDFEETSFNYSYVIASRKPLTKDEKMWEIVRDDRFTRLEKLGVIQPSGKLDFFSIPEDPWYFSNDEREEFLHKLAVEKRWDSYDIGYARKVLYSSKYTKKMGVPECGAEHAVSDGSTRKQTIIEILTEQHAPKKPVVSHCDVSEISEFVSPWCREKQDGEYVFFTHDGTVAHYEDRDEEAESKILHGERLSDGHVVDLAPDSKTNKWRDVRDNESSEVIAVPYGVERKFKEAPSYELQVMDGVAYTLDRVRMCTTSVSDGIWEFQHGLALRERKYKTPHTLAAVTQILNSVTPNQLRAAITCPKVAYGSLPWIDGPIVAPGSRNVSDRELGEFLLEWRNYSEIVKWVRDNKLIVPLAQLERVYDIAGQSIARAIVVDNVWEMSDSVEPLELCTLNGVHYPRQCLGEVRRYNAVAGIIRCGADYLFSRKQGGKWDFAFAGTVATNVDSLVPESSISCFKRECAEELDAPELNWVYQDVVCPVANVFLGVAEVSRKQKDQIAGRERRELAWSKLDAFNVATLRTDAFTLWIGEKEKRHKWKHDYEVRGEKRKRRRRPPV